MSTPCPFCGVARRADYPVEFLCGTCAFANGEIAQSKRCRESERARLHSRIEALEAALRGILDNDGSRSVFSATRVWDARAKAEELLKEAKLAAITPIAATDDLMRSLAEKVGKVRNNIRTETESPVWRTEFKETKP